MPRMHDQLYVKLACFSEYVRLMNLFRGLAANCVTYAIVEVSSRYVNLELTKHYITSVKPQTLPIE